ncbi:hypothetical protein ACE1B6_03790 [Aerosakkonemataceae cyanobacterium BLCC-F154]|uniref:Uncharacterized protein n=1 Tax=Floridaenema fluviatile BLCC-F154 TaxID=3153640 RepID=A0ABV4Y8C3_9CYAN
MKKLVTLLFLMIIVLIVSLLLNSQQVVAEQWRPVKGGINFGISGMALIDRKDNALDFLVVHDNKGKDQGRLAIVTIKDGQQPEYFPWNSASDLNELYFGSDLEAITAVPTAPSSFMALSSKGKVYYFRLGKRKGESFLLRVFDLPNLPEKPNFEGFAVQEIDNKLLAVWAERGEGEKPGIIYWGILNLSSFQIELKGSKSFTVPWPNSPHLRHISDLKIDRLGTVFISSTIDPGNDGPFTSAVYIAGVFVVNGNEVSFRENSDLFPLYRLDYHKVEAIELVPGANGGIIVGTDDENMGSWLYMPNGN